MAAATTVVARRLRVGQLLLHPVDDLLTRDAVARVSDEGLQSSSTVAASRQWSCRSPERIGWPLAVPRPSLVDGLDAKASGVGVFFVVSLTEGNWKDGDPVASLDGDEARWLGSPDQVGGDASLPVDVQLESEWRSS